MIAVIDNYDSFTYNLVHYLEDITGEHPMVYKNDSVNWTKIDQCSHLVLSPGPGLPSASGELMRVIEKYHNRKNILGVCLGMQAIGEFFGARLKNLNEVQHGVQTKIRIKIFPENKLYKGLSSEIEVGRYHSWVVDEDQLPEDLIITATDKLGNLMSFQHSSLSIYAVQYHPESIMTPTGKQILMNWLNV